MIAIHRSEEPALDTLLGESGDTVAADPADLVFGSLRLVKQENPWSSSAPRRDDNEIISYVVEGPLVRHDHDNVVDFRRERGCQTGSQDRTLRSFEESIRLLQSWILREEPGLDPAAVSTRGLRLLASGDGRYDSLRIQQDIDLYSTRLEGGERITHNLRPGRCAWVQVVRGTLEVNGRRLENGDGAGVTKEDSLCFEASSLADVLLFDVAGTLPE